jgi:hypothetical protein
MDGWLYEQIHNLNIKMDFLINKLQEAENKAKENKDIKK